MRVYLAGPMRSRPLFNFPAFHAAAAQLRAMGHEVFNPAERDIAEDGFDPACDEPKSLLYYMQHDLPAVMASDAVAVLPGWDESQGTRLEVHVARECGLAILDAATGAPLQEDSVNVETSGGARYSKGKPSGWWYAPLYGLRLVAPVWEYGSAKYAPMDWKEGQSFSVLLDCAMRHTLEVLDKGPWARDPESGCYHASHACWNWLCLLTFMALGRKELDDTEQWRGVTARRKERTDAT